MPDLHFVDSGSIPDTSKAREAQLVEQNIEDIWVVSSSLITGIWMCWNGQQVSLRMKWLIPLQVRFLSSI